METFKSIVPLLVVVLTAALSGYLVPRITREWQDYQKDVEVRTSLVEEVSRAVVNILLAVQLSVRGALSQRDLDDAYREWEMRRAILVARIRAYFVDPQTAEVFEDYFNAVGDIYSLGEMQHPEHRARHVEKLRAFFGASATDWAKLESQNLYTDDRFGWFQSWWELRQNALLRKDALIQQLLLQGDSYFEAAQLGSQIDTAIKALRHR